MEVQHQREHLARWLAAIEAHGHLLPATVRVESVQTDGDDGTAVADMVGAMGFSRTDDRGPDKRMRNVATAIGGINRANATTVFPILEQ
jgi:hypothetical protein